MIISKRSVGRILRKIGLRRRGTSRRRYCEKIPEMYKLGSSTLTYGPSDFCFQLPCNICVLGEKTLGRNYPGDNPERGCTAEFLEFSKGCDWGGKGAFVLTYAQEVVHLYQDIFNLIDN